MGVQEPIGGHDCAFARSSSEVWREGHMGLRRRPSLAFSHAERSAGASVIGQRNTIPSPPGSCAALSAARICRGVSGNARRRPGDSASTRRLWRVSRSRRITRDMPASRCLRWILRSVACTSNRCVSASTIARKCAPRIEASSARMSPGIWSQTSVSHSSERCSPAWRRSRRSRCARSRAGDDTGWHPTLSSMPNMAHRRAAVNRSAETSPRSTLPTAACDIPTSRPS